MMNIEYTKGLTTVDWLWFFGAAFLFSFLFQFVKDRLKGGDLEKLLKIPDYFEGIEESSLHQLVDQYRQGGISQVEQSFTEHKSKGIRELALRLSQFEDHALLRSVYEDRFQMAASEGTELFYERWRRYQRILEVLTAVVLVILAPIPYLSFAQTLCTGAGVLFAASVAWIQAEFQKARATEALLRLKHLRKIVLRNLVLIQLGITSKHALD